MAEKSQLQRPISAKRSTFAGQDYLGCITVKRLKDETLSIRTSADIKQLLKLAADREHRSVASMVEVLVLTYAQEHGLQAEPEVSVHDVDKKRQHGTH